MTNKHSLRKAIDACNSSIHRRRVHSLGIHGGILTIIGTGIPLGATDLTKPLVLDGVAHWGSLGCGLVVDMNNLCVP
ncbi:hypothetical protein BDW62DRAFT_196274 [Aspergillus aurantiobrunneus]